jgi:hypothetical protein
VCLCVCAAVYVCMCFVRRHGGRGAGGVSHEIAIHKKTQTKLVQLVRPGLSPKAAGEWHLRDQHASESHA